MDLTVSGATTNTLSLSTLTAANTVAAASGYDCIVSGTAPHAAATSTRVALTVNTNSIHQFTARCTNSLFDSPAQQATITAAGTGPTYQWRLNGVNLVDGANVAGSTTATPGYPISPVPIRVAAASGYDCVVVGAAPCAAVTSTRVALTVNMIATIGGQPANQTTCAGTAKRLV